MSQTAPEELPIPGVVLGTYPERRERRRNTNPLAANFRAVGMLAPFRRRGDWQAFTLEVRARREILELLSEQSFALIVSVTRTLLRAEGFAHSRLAEGMACACESARRALGVTPFDTQIIAARLMLDNQLAEMATGEGKTMAIALAAGIAAMAGIPVHCITANDYLVTRDAQNMKPLYERLRVSLGTVTQPDTPAARRLAYASDITYCTAKELVFDYLKDVVQLGASKHDLLHRVQTLTQQETGWQQPLLRGLCMAIVDEADSILLDEAGVPLILARAGKMSDGADHLRQALRVARNLRAGRHFELAGEQLHLTEAARQLLTKLSQNLPTMWRDVRVREELIHQALRALHLHRRDEHYIVQNGKVCIVDQTTGRLAEGRAWSRGVHQLIELKEGCELTASQDTMAKITYQRFFPRYIRLSGTSGTMFEARSEMKAQYRMTVARVPLRAPSQRADLGTLVYPNHKAKWAHVAQRVKAMHDIHRPVLVGTDSVSESEILSRLIGEIGVPHSVLNARQDGEEAGIVARAGQSGAVTVATNMAGRGTDIALGDGVAALGGLHVICCQLNSEARIDRQLHGRAARQGDPGSFETVLCLDEPVLQRWIPLFMRRLTARWRGETRPLPALVANPMLHLCQWLEQHSRAAQRRALARRDTLDGQRFSLGGVRE